MEKKKQIVSGRNNNFVDSISYAIHSNPSRSNLPTRCSNPTNFCMDIVRCNNLSYFFYSILSPFNLLSSLTVPSTLIIIISGVEST